MKITQACISAGLGKVFRDKFFGMYGFAKYFDKKASCVFFGVYDWKDFGRIKKHEGMAVILWGGTDAELCIKRNNRLKWRKIFNRAGVYHLAISDDIHRDLVGKMKLNPGRVKKIMFSLVDLDFYYQPQELGKAIYIYTHKNHPERYGKQVYRKIMKAFPKTKFIVTHYDTYKSVEKLRDVYRKCFVGLRLTKHDGNANTVQELGLLGIRCFHRGNMPNAIPWKGVDDIIAGIKTEMEKIGTVQAEIAKKVYNVLNVEPNWLSVDFYQGGTKRGGGEAKKNEKEVKREKIKELAKINVEASANFWEVGLREGWPRVSVVMNVYRESEKFLVAAVESYLKQLGVVLELIICTVEGDPCVEVIRRRFGKWIGRGVIRFCVIKLAKHPGRGHLGIYYQLNVAVGMIRYDWFAYASSNDVALPNKLKGEVETCKKGSGKDGEVEKKVCYSDFNMVDSKGKMVRKIRPHGEYNYKKHLTRNFISDCALVEVDLLRKYLPFQANLYRNHAYWDLWLRIYQGEGNVFINRPKAGFLYRQHDSTSIRVETAKSKTKKAVNQEYRSKLLKDHGDTKVKNKMGEEKKEI